MTDKTIQFKLQNSKDDQIKEMLSGVYDALEEKGYNPISQIVGYILSEDPAYITTHNNARNMILKIDRYELLQSLIKNYLGK
ncbi:MAG: IreB family regulatory phosphoprotein [Oscillospiraceae bacterium]|nr:IreB family regulatory phosphoprotein [Oscillospiraceae bacterium]MDD7354372.1 IreB family regulatory phosphoprotein [Oscillospiraceae bacterium]MDY3938412.1 IreB family regulatory phosphoprotein [Oscillospiraceae bacterium]